MRPHWGNGIQTEFPPNPDELSPTVEERGNDFIAGEAWTDWACVSGDPLSACRRKPHPFPHPFPQTGQGRWAPGPQHLVPRDEGRTWPHPLSHHLSQGGRLLAKRLTQSKNTFLRLYDQRKFWSSEQGAPRVGSYITDTGRRLCLASAAFPVPPGPGETQSWSPRRKG